MVFVNRIWGLCFLIAARAACWTEGVEISEERVEGSRV